ncbi:MFS transporter [Xylanimonas oleitrophica]|uniref:MFS transporter n=1 Tax=Xylanimonas oleitrophica TaxID=2607479 RepID=UPI0015D04F70|nr:MFS transporter [Xylanimonas oleitrophica]
MTALARGRTAFHLWLCGSTVSALGDAVTGFAVGWAAAAHGPQAAGLVLTAGSAPLCLVLLVGGVLADRWGFRRTLVGCHAVMIAAMVTLALVAAAGPVPLGALVASSVVAGTVAALRRPAEGAFPRLFALPDELPRVMATVTVALQSARVAGPGVGGLLLGGGGLAAVAWVDAASFAIALAVVLLVRPPYEPAAAGDAPRPGLREALAAFGLARATPGVPAALVAVVGLALTVLPLVALCVPLAGRERGWGATATGVVAGAWVVGALLVSLVVVVRGAPPAPLAATGPALAAAGAAVLAVTDGVVPAAVGVGLVGAGSSVLTTALMPRFVTATPSGRLARFQALLALAQALPVLVATPLLGSLASRWGAGAALALVVAALLVTTVPARRALCTLPVPSP